MPNVVWQVRLPLRRNNAPKLQNPGGHSSNVDPACIISMLHYEDRCQEGILEKEDVVNENIKLFETKFQSFRRCCKQSQ